MLHHHFSVDVEEYFQVSAFESTVARADWDHMQPRAARYVIRILELLNESGARGTFFVLGWVAHRYPGLIREIAAAGHEIASHGWDHRRVNAQTPTQFRESVRRTRRELQDITGASVRGFRAPSYSITPGCEWALDALLEEGHTYDSSLFPVWRPDGYGYRGISPDPHWLCRPAGRLAEIPPTTLRRAGVSFPAAGGAYFRIFPYALVHAAFDDCERRDMPGTFYVHPWELDPTQPRLRVPWHAALRHYTGLHRTEPRLRRLLRDFRFTAIEDTVGRL